MRKEERQNNKIIHLFYLVISIIFVAAGFAFLKLGMRLPGMEDMYLFSYIIIGFGLLGLFSSIFGIYRLIKHRKRSK